MAVIQSVVLAAALAGAALAGSPGSALAADAVVVKTAPAPARQLADLADRYYEEQARFEPIDATFNGDNRFDDLLPMTLVPAVRARQFAMLHEVREQLMGSTAASLARSTRPRSTSSISRSTTSCGWSRSRTTCCR
jgi:hypothetical protein